MKHLPSYLTAVCYDFKMLLADEQHKIVVINSLKYLVDAEQIIIYGYVIMSNHIHIIWHAIGIKTNEQLQRSLLKYTADEFKKCLKNTNEQFLAEFLVNKKDRNYQFWKRDSVQVDLYSEFFFRQKLEYIHMNPVRAGLCALPEDYKYSSAVFYETGLDIWGLMNERTASRW
ncbi:MAG: transposase [Bacteroidota bacterium]